MDSQTQYRLLRAARQAIVAEKLLGVDAVPMHVLDLPAVRAAPVTTIDTGSTAHSPPPASPVQPTPARAAPARPAPVAPSRPAAAVPASSLTVHQLIGSQPVPAIHSVQLDRETKISLLQRMDETEVRACNRCVLCEGRTQTVFGEGDPDARLMFIGEGPGEVEDQTGRPFVGPAGELLMKMITAMGLSRERVFIANVVKCRPPGNRVPAPAEMIACQGYLFRQIQAVQPRVIVALGGTATKHLLSTEKGITMIRGQWHTITTPVFENPALATTIPVMPTFHPSYVLRAYTPENRKKVWSDLQQVMALLGTASGT